ncbi:MAG TPA: DUF3500 domain-containing protein [Vicinamibacterales bacterium]|jgi:hypothetical protein|nr:DUF3500 domain-containing protein [Vicinamibacterales bacterium]
MHVPLRFATMTCLVLCVVTVASVPAQRAATAAPPSGAQADVTARITASAQALLTKLDDAGRAKVQFPSEGPQKMRWSNLPSPMFERQGLRMGALTSTQRAAVKELLAVALSRDGYRKVTEIMQGDEVLRSRSSQGPRGGGANPSAGRAGAGGRGGPAFGEDEYYLAFLGTPSSTSPWMLQFGGHHLAINLTLAGSQATMAPSLPAAQPATFTVEGRTIRPLGNENDKAFALINALNTEQRGQAILNSRVADLVLGPGQDGKTIQPEGIHASALSAAHQTMLWELVREWVGIMNDAFAEPRMTEIRAKPADTYFAWSGPTTNGSAAYFRVQGPTLVIEYAPQQGSVDHIHTIYRDPTNDYGAKFTK